ncbi:MAG: DUF4349 domain-containing protein [Pseudonocardiaceae bacterium]
MRGTRVLVWACLAAMLAGCSTSAGEGGGATASQPTVGAEAPGSDDAQRGAPAGQAQRDSSAPDTGRPGGTGPPVPVGQPVPASSRQVVRDATVELRVDNLAQATERARLIGPSHGGFVAAEESTPEVSSLTLRVAGTELDAALAALAELGEVTARRLSTQDVTEQTVDLAARINSQRASVERVRALLDRATTIGEVVQVESELTWRQAELESLQQRAAALADQVALSTIRVRLAGPESEPAAGAGGFGSGLAAGWDALLASGRVVLRVIGVVLPFAMVLAVPVGVALLWYRRRRRAAEASAGG